MIQSVIFNNIVHVKHASVDRISVLNENVVDIVKKRKKENIKFVFDFSGRFVSQEVEYSSI